MRESCYTDIKGGAENEYGKVNILMQTHISREQVESFSLVSDMAYVAQVSVACDHFKPIVSPFLRWFLPSVYP